MIDAYEPRWMNEELRILKDACKRFYETEMTPHADRWEKQGYIDRDAWNKAGGAGLLCAAIPEEFGGAGGNFTHEAVIFQQQVYSGAVGFGNGVHSGIVSHYINVYGTEEQKARWLPRMASGELVAAIAMSEPGVGSDLQSVRTTAIKTGNQYVVNGAKTFISNGWQANLICVIAKTDPSEKAKGVSLVMVETDEVDGFRRGRRLDKLGLKAQDTSELFFDDVKVPTENLLGFQEGQGFYQLMQQLPRERLVIAVNGLASMEKAINHTIDYVKEREAFGKKVITFQNTRFKLVECWTKLKVCRAFVDECIEKLMDNRLDVVSAAMAKYYVTDAQCEVIDECLQLHGGYGYMEEYPIARMYRDSRVQRIYGGTNEIMKELISRAL